MDIKTNHKYYKLNMIYDGSFSIEEVTVTSVNDEYIAFKRNISGIGDICVDFNRKHFENEYTTTIGLRSIIKRQIASLRTAISSLLKMDGDETDINNIKKGSTVFALVFNKKEKIYFTKILKVEYVRRTLQNETRFLTLKLGAIIFEGVIVMYSTGVSYNSRHYISRLKFISAIETIITRLKAIFHNLK